MQPSSQTRITDPTSCPPWIPRPTALNSQMQMWLAFVLPRTPVTPRNVLTLTWDAQRHSCFAFHGFCFVFKANQKKCNSGRKVQRARPNPKRWSRRCLAGSGRQFSCDTAARLRAGLFQVLRLQTAPSRSLIPRPDPTIRASRPCVRAFLRHLRRACRKSTHLDP